MGAMPKLTKAGTRSALPVRSSRQAFEEDVLGAFPDDASPRLFELIAPIDDGEEMVAGELAEFAGEAGRAVGEEDFGFAEPAGIEQHLARRRVTGGVLEPDPDVEVTERNPGRFAAPARLNQLVAEGQKGGEGGAAVGGAGFLHFGGEGELVGDLADGDSEHGLVGVLSSFR